MNSNKHEHDPKLTAHALGELSGSEREQIEALLRDDETARQVVEEIRATAALVASGLKAEATNATLTDVQRLAIAQTTSHADASTRSRFVPSLLTVLAAAAIIAVCVSVMLPALSKARSRSQTVSMSVPQKPAVTPPANSAAGDKTQLPALKQDSFRLSDSLEAAQRKQQSQVQDSVSAVSIAPSQPSQQSIVNGSAQANAPLAVRGTKRVTEGPVRRAPNNSPSDEIARTALAPAPDFNLETEVDATRPSRAGYNGPFNTEAYDRITDNAFFDARQNPLSTFSIDVDTASYSNVRRFINEQSQLPPRDAVRIEEMINYFPYSYPAPQGDAPFGANIEVAGCPWNSDHRLVRIALKGKEIAKENRPPSNLVFLIDVSGSMQPENKLPLLKRSMQRLVGELRENDRVAIVVYAGNSGLVLPSTTCDDRSQRTILDALERLQPGGSTNGAAGIQLAYQVATENFIKEGTNRVILCTDGDFNVGVTNQGDLTRLIEEKAKSNVFLSVLGFGMGNVKDSTMERLADKGNGNYAYIDTMLEANKVLVEQMSGTLITIAKDVKIQVEFNPAKVGTYRLIGYENRMLAKEDFNDDKKDAGEIGAGHTVTALYEIAPVGAKGDAPAVDPLKYQTAGDGATTATQLDAAKVDLSVKRAALERIEKSGAGAYSPAEIEEARLNVQLREAQVRVLEERLARIPANTTAPAPSDELLTVKLRYKAPDAPLEQGTSKLLEFPIKDSNQPFASVSKDFKFASSVAAFGMVLRESPHKGNATLDAVIELAQEGRSADEAGYRGEFIELVRKAKTLSRR